MIGLPDAPVSNLAPPTAALVVLAVGQAAVIAWLSRRFGTALATPAWRRLLDLANRPLMTIYLWHLPAMMLVIGVALAAPRTLLPAPGPDWWLTRPAWLAGCVLMLVLLVRAWHRVERIDLPAVPVAVPALAVAGAVLATVAVYQIWRHGVLLTGSGSAARIAAVLALASSPALIALGQLSRGRGLRSGGK